MKTCTVQLGSKSFEAAPLTAAETILVSRTMAEMEVGLRGDRQAAFAAISESTETLAAVLLTALRKVDPEFPATKVWEAMPTEITAAIGVLILASCDPDALADVISIAQQVRQ